MPGHEHSSGKIHAANIQADERNDESVTEPSANSIPGIISRNLSSAEDTVFTSIRFGKLDELGQKSFECRVLGVESEPSDLVRDLLSRLEETTPKAKLSESNEAR